jgi:hypothetical protein
VLLQPCGAHDATKLLTYSAAAAGISALLHNCGRPGPQPPLPCAAAPPSQLAALAGQGDGAVVVSSTPGVKRLHTCSTTALQAVVNGASDQAARPRMYASVLRSRQAGTPSHLVSWLLRRAPVEPGVLGPEPPPPAADALALCCRLASASPSLWLAASAAGGRSPASLPLLSESAQPPEGLCACGLSRPGAAAAAPALGVLPADELVATSARPALADASSKRGESGRSSGCCCVTACAGPPEQLSCSAWLMLLSRCRVPAALLPTAAPALLATRDPGSLRCSSCASRGSNACVSLSAAQCLWAVGSSRHMRCRVTLVPRAHGATPHLLQLLQGCAGAARARLLSCVLLLLGGLDSGHPRVALCASAGLHLEQQAALWEPDLWRAVDCEVRWCGYCLQAGATSCSAAGHTRSPGTSTRPRPAQPPGLPQQTP